VPILVSSLVVIFAVVEVLILPFAAQAYLSHQPLVAGAWLGLVGQDRRRRGRERAIAESLILASAAAEGVNYQKGGSWGRRPPSRCSSTCSSACGRSCSPICWTTTSMRRPPTRPGHAKSGIVSEVHHRLLLTFLVVLLLTWGASPELIGKIKSAAGQANVFRVIFFVLTFFSIGVLSNFRRLCRRASASWSPCTR